MAQSAGRRFYEEQIEYLKSRDVDGLIENHYCEDAVIISFDFPAVTGTAALKQHFRNYLEMLGELQVDSTDNFTEIEDAIYFEASVTTSKLGKARVYDAFVLRDGKIRYHFTGRK